MADERKYWVGLTLVKGIGSVRMGSLLNWFGAAESAWLASLEDLKSAGLSPRLAESLIQVRSSDLLEKTWEQIHKEDIGILTWDDADYPRRLKEIDQPPPVIYYRGKLSAEDQWAVAVVGTRRVTAYGRQVADEIGSELARHGVTVVSGLARGVDSIAHQACLKSGGRTIAVLGSGVDQIYPPEHKRLAENIIENGAVISDYPPGALPEAANFPPRNRIISALSQAVVVVEASEKSGALITAAFAAQQGREVFAVPGYLYAPQSVGANRLIESGARIYTGISSLLDALNLEHTDQYKSARAVLPTDATEAALYSLLGREPLHVDEIQLQTSLPIEQVSSALTMMELKGLVRQVGTMRYIAIYETSPEYTIEE
ncbi:MAG: DNA protecting protein DprA [Anaerolineae bacterium UTCFX2]|jgi:DNA processing protein|nr:DNA-protecting protein DprA [Anaerolineae bacterium]MCZ7554128.1 DNA-processing protein DprA [Anaerolineales bacterium]OQY89278.1 MAG: DNA protecting protein DprA [Anaerolineae bacterium UTCFX2]